MGTITILPETTKNPITLMGQRAGVCWGGNVEDPEKNYLVLVPEQFTMQTQQKLVELAPNHAIMNIDVLSFKRLAYRVFDDMGMQDIQVLEETGKNLVLRKLAQEQEETLTVLRANMNRCRSM